MSAAPIQPPECWWLECTLPVMYSVRGQSQLLRTLVCPGHLAREVDLLIEQRGCEEVVVTSVRPQPE